MKLGYNPRFDVEHCRKLGKRFEHSDDTPRMIGGKGYERTLALVCKGCGSVFFAYKPIGSDWPPYVDPMTVSGPANGIHDTCGDPRCWEQMIRQSDNGLGEASKKYFDEKAGRSSGTGTEFKPKSTKLSKLGE